ncbi:protein fantom-like isoform X2 [Nematostella vectensis]|nr:protein fantom-like isoform X2 [Nematostella vectensis]
MPASSMDSYTAANQEADADGRPFSEVHAKQLISKISREELEDKFLRLQEENTELKKYARKQEEKIKKMATKLLRLVSDKKKRELADGVPKGKDIEAEEKIADLNDKIIELEKQNGLLKNKLTVAKQQIQTQSKRTTPYDNVTPRINTGLHHVRTPSGNRLKKNLRVQGADVRPGSMATPPLLPQPRYGHSLLEEARLEKRELEEVIGQLEDEVQVLEEEKRMLKLQLEQNELEHQEELNRARDQLTGMQRGNLQENVELIKLQRDVKDKMTKLQAVQAKYQSLEENLAKVKISHSQVLDEMDSLNTKLKEEQTKNMMLKNEMKSKGIAEKSMTEQVQLITDLKAENEILKEANEKLVNSAFDVDREQQHRNRYRQQEVEIEQLRATLNSDLKEKNEILDKLSEERGKAEKVEEELRQLRVQHYTLKEQYDDLREKMKFFTKESAVDFQEIEEALVLIKQRKEKGSQDLDFLEKVDDEIGKDVKKQHQELMAAHADTVNELEKTRNMLIIQHKINKDYKTEVDRVTRKMTDDKKEYDLKMQEYAQLLDIRAERIRKLESQMHDIAYGTKQYKAVSGTEESEYEEVDSTLELERGQNVFEIHIDKVVFNDSSRAEFEDAEPVTFVTYEFFEHELQATPVLKGMRPLFNFTSQYLVRVDDFFLHYLQKESTLVELHRAFGTDFKTIAACQLRFRDLLEKSHGRVHGSAKLIGRSPGTEGTEIASMEYWVRLRVPMDQAIRLYRERTKALGYMDSNAYKALENAGHGAEKAPLDINELGVHIIRCTGVKANNEAVQPSPYAVYKFFDFADHDTKIIPSSNMPEFNDVKTFPVPMTTELDSYLRAAVLEVYVFDDSDPDVAAYLGVANVPLITLANDKPIKGTFTLHKASGSENGTVDVFLRWRYTYLPASAKPRATPQRLMAVPADGSPPIDDVTIQDELARRTIDSNHMVSTPKSTSPPKRDSSATQNDARMIENASRDQLESRKDQESHTEKPRKHARPRTASRERNQEIASEPNGGSLEDMSHDELAVAASEKPKPKPRTRTISQASEPDKPVKPVEEMSVDEMILAANGDAQRERPADEIKEEITNEFDDDEEEEEGHDEEEKVSSEVDKSDEERVAEEMRRTAEQGEQAASDTMFEEEHHESDTTLGDDVDIPLPARRPVSELEESEGETTESEGLVVSPSPARLATASQPTYTIT